MPLSQAADTISLAGSWRLRLDVADHGVQAHWAASPLDTADRITLPNTTDRAGFGFALDTNTMLHAAPFPVSTRFPGVKEPQRADEHGYLVRRHLFVGPAWYEREVEIPESWKSRPVSFRLERAMWKTDAWLDGRPIGSSDSLVAEHRYELGVVPPGKHRLTVRVDNRMIHNLSTITHAYGPETQTRWNGLIGDLRLEASQPVSIRSLAVYPAADRLSVHLVMVITNRIDETVSVSLRAQVLDESKDELVAKPEWRISVPFGVSTHAVTIRLAQRAQAWDEFAPARYHARVTLETKTGSKDEQTAVFGFRHIERVGKAIRLNGRTIFLRGTLDCAVYPKTGHPPMTLAEWERILGAVKEYGFNHVRFHTWCPPEAAFEAADRLGVYLQPEAPAWVDDWGVSTVTKPQGIGHDPAVVDFLRSEMRRISEAYGNHPSFVLFAIGNEFGMSHTDWPQVNAMIEEIKVADPRRLYTGCAARRHLAVDGFWVTHNSGAGTRGVGPAHTDWDFAKAAEASPVPLIAHETGQRPVFPDYGKLLPKFTGPLLPLNLERYRRGLESSGMADQMGEFVRASARFQLAQYKAEHEGMLRTRGYAGYQLLMLNDFTGQSEALVGMLDPFWESKGVVSAAEVRQWNAPTVVLARFAKYGWSSDETFRARMEVAHFGPTNLPPGHLTWTITAQDGRVIGRGDQVTETVPVGVVSSLGAISLELRELERPEAVTLTARVAGFENQWKLWVYPTGGDEPEPAGVTVTRILDDGALDLLRSGGKVLLLANSLKNAQAARTGFESVYWSAGWWGNKFSSLGVLCDPKHPALAEFPSEGHSDWQWRDLCAGATTFHLDGAPRAFRPIVQPVPDFHFNSLLAHVFEAKVGKGALLVSGYDLDTNLERRPAARQFRRSLFRYLSSPKFQPKQEVSAAWVERMFSPAGLLRRGAKIVEASSEDRENGNLAANAIDGDPATIWHTRWQPKADPIPHHLVLDLGREMKLVGITCLPRQDQANGRIGEVEVLCSNDPASWGQPMITARWTDTKELQVLRFSRHVSARYLKIVARSEFSRQPFASIAELDVLYGEQ